MKIVDLIKMEEAVLSDLSKRAASGDNEASRVILEHLRATSRNIEKWRDRKVSKLRTHREDE